MLKRLLKLPSPFTICLFLAWAINVHADESQAATPDESLDSVVVFEEVQETEDVDVNSNLEPDVKMSLDDEEAYREKTEVEADEIVKKARIAFQNDEYENSVNLYLTAIKKLKNASPYKTSEHIESKIQNIHQSLAVVYHYWAKDIAQQAQKKADAGKFQEAIEKCVKAMKIEPLLTGTMEDMIKRFEKLKKSAKYTTESSEEKADPNKQSRLYQIDVLMVQGDKLYNTKQWDMAREKYEKILQLDPYNTRAIAKIKKLTKAMYEAGKARYRATAEERNAEVDWNYVSPLIARSEASNPENIAPIEKEEIGTKIKQKLENIVIDHLEFQDATISAVVNLLRVRAKELDPEKEGVNMFLRLNAPAATGGDDSMDEGDDTEEDDSFLEDEETDGTDDMAEDDTGDDMEDSDTSAGEKTVTIMFDDLTLEEAIRSICAAADMNYRVEEYAVVIASKEIPLETLETRIYPLEKLGSAGFGDADTDNGTASVKDYFERRGVSFPAEARIVYDSSISRLIATNTHENLRKIEEIIDELNVVDPQVLIESKFVEIQENKANELGFEWTVSKNSPSGIQFDQNDQLLRFDKDVAGAKGRLEGKDVAFDLTRTNNKGVRVNLKVHAMDLQSRTDILSCPRITTQNGEEATIRMVTDVFFPESWGETTIVTDTTGTGFTASMPEFGDPTELGVRLTVTPTVDPDKYTISLDMVPVVQTHVDWTDYSYEVPSADIDNNLIYLPNILRMPIIEARTVQTQITIYDGETVVLGGIMRDITGTVDDRIPLLGDLPLVGRAFRSKIVDKRKANLLIFTTVRLVNPDGSPLREREVRGKPPFRL